MKTDCDSMFRDDLDGLLERLSSLLGVKVRQKLTDWRSLIHLIITPSTIINILHPIVIFLSAILLPHCYSFWIQIPLYLVYLFIASKWCRYVAKLKVKMKKQQNRSDIIMPTLEMCKEEGEDKQDNIHFFHLKNLAPPDGQGTKDFPEFVEEKISKKSANCKTFLVLGDLSDEEVKQNEPVWLNKAIKQFWINLRAALEDVIMNVIWPDIRKTIKDYPANIDLELYSLGLGMVAPRIENIKVQKDSEGTFNENLIVDINVTFASEASIDFRLKTDLNPKVSLRLDSIVLSVKVRIGLIGIMSDIPLVKGVGVTILENPEIDWSLGGIGKLADMSWMDKIIKDLITDQIRMFVIPNKITVPLNCINLPPNIQEHIDQMDPSIFHSIIVPEPTGLVKVIIKSGSNLPANDYTSSLMRPKLLFTSPLSFLKKIIPGKRSSDPYVKVSVGSTSFQSEVCFNTLNPEFNFSCEIPVECSSGQELKISFWDYDSTSHNDWLGSREEFLTNLVRKFADGKDSPELAWYGITGTVSGKCLMSSQWIPVTVSKNKDLSGVVAFSITGVRGDTVSMPDIKISLRKDDTVFQLMEDDMVCKGPLEWFAMPAFNESKEFKLGMVGSLEFDLFLLKGGMLRFNEEHKELLIEVHDKLDRETEIGRRVWRHQLPLTEVVRRAKPGESLTFSLEKGYDQKSNCVNKTKQLLGYFWKTLTGQESKEGTIEAFEDEKMEIDLMFTFYTDCN